MDAQVIPIGAGRGRRRAAPGEKFLSKKQVAEHYGVSTSTIDNWVREDDMPWHPLRGRPGARPRRRFLLSETDSWMERTGRLD